MQYSTHGGDSEVLTIPAAGPNVGLAPWWRARIVCHGVKLQGSLLVKQNQGKQLPESKAMLSSVYIVYRTGFLFCTVHFSEEVLSKCGIAD